MPYERDRSRVVELTEDVVEEQHRGGTGELADDFVTGEPQREREGALLALRCLRTRVESSYGQAPLVTVRPDERDSSFEFRPPPHAERLVQARLDGLDVRGVERFR